MLRYTKRNFPLYFFVDLLITGHCYFLSYIFRYNSLDKFFTRLKLLDLSAYVVVFFVWMLSIAYFFWRQNLYSTEKQTKIAEEVWRIIIGVTGAAILTAAFIFFAKYKFFSRRVFIESLFLFCILLSSWRIIKRVVVRRLMEGRLSRLNAAIIILIKTARIAKRFILRHADAAIRLFLYLLIAVLPFSKAGVEIASIAVLSLWAVKRLLQKDLKPQDNILNAPILAYVIAGVFSVIGSVYFNESLRAFFSKFLEGLLLYLVIIEVISTRRQVYIIVGILTAATGVVCADGIIQRFFGGIDIFRKMPLVKGGITAAFNHKNDLGAYMLLPISLVFALTCKWLYGIRRKWLTNTLMAGGLFMLLSLFMFTMFLTNSRGAWLALIFGILIIYFLVNNKIFLVVTMCCLAAFAFYNYLEEYTGQMLSASDFKRDTFGRLGVWKDAIFMIKQRPAFGNGLNTYMRLVSKMWITREPIYAHNCYLQIGAEIGIVGLLCFLWIIARLFKRCISEIIKKGMYDSFLLTGLLSGLSAFLLHSFVDTNLYSLQLGLLFWYIVGVTVCAYQLSIKLSRDVAK